MIRLLSWNILSPQASDIMHFKNHYPQILDWNNRFNRIIKKIVLLNPDIICLQEVDVHNAKKFENVLDKYGFNKGSYQKKGLNEGVLIFYQNSKFKLINHNGMLLTAQKKLESPGAACWATISSKHTQKNYIVASLHLFWQLQKEQLYEFFINLLCSPTSTMIFAGDFNIPYTTMLNEIIPNIQQNYQAPFNQLCMFEHVSLTAQPPHHNNPHIWESLDHVIMSKNLQIDTQHSFVADSQKSYHNDHVATNKLIIDNNKKSIPHDAIPSDHTPIILNFSESL